MLFTAWKKKARDDVHTMGVEVLASVDSSAG
jgi:hypothetical protein